MAILSSKTTVNSEKTIAEIMKMLASHGATKIAIDYDGAIPVAVTFGLLLNGNIVGFLLPANYKGVLASLEKDKKVPRSLVTKDQALKVSWRIVSTWIKAQMAIVDAEVVDMTEVFLPYAITKSGRTVYHELKSGNLPMLNSKNK